MFIKEKLHFTDKVLFIAHLAIGDFTYLQNCFKKLKDRYPTLKIDLFIQDVRMTDDEAKWEGLKNYILYEWVQETGLFHKIYYGYSPQVHAQSILECKNEQYPYVISLGDLRSQNYSLLAREIAQNNIALGINIKTHLFSFAAKKALKSLDFKIKDLTDKSAHISEKFAYWFEQFADITFTKDDRYPFIHIPEIWDEKALEYLLKHQWDRNSPIVFINIFAKGDERCWSLEEATTLIKKLKNTEQYANAIFILNSLPEDLTHLETEILKNALSSTFVFSAQLSFFELPALLKRCDLIITVDTSIMHLATFSSGKLISLLRKNRKKPSPRWLPLKKEQSIIIYTEGLGAPIASISAEKVLDKIV